MILLRAIWESQKEDVEMVQAEMTCPISRGERILVAVGGSDYCDSIVEQAISMGRICNSVILAISVVEMHPETIELAPAAEKEARETLEKVKSRIEEEDIVCETIIGVDGKPHKPIVQEAKDREVDLIVMGTHGKTRLVNALMGSVAQKVIGTAPCPVMVIPC
jgi:nucleotide-binding universal stress UspA family protein